METRWTTRIARLTFPFPRRECVDDLEALVERLHQALAEFFRGDPRPATLCSFSENDDVTLGNPFGPFVRGFEGVRTRPPPPYRDGEVVGFEKGGVRNRGPAGFVEIERYRAKVGGSHEWTDVALRSPRLFAARGTPGRSRAGTPTRSSVARPAESVIQRPQQG